MTRAKTLLVSMAIAICAAGSASANLTYTLAATDNGSDPIGRTYSGFEIVFQSLDAILTTDEIVSFTGLTITRPGRRGRPDRVSTFDSVFDVADIVVDGVTLQGSLDFRGGPLVPGEPLVGSDKLWWFKGPRGSARFTSRYLDYEVTTASIPVPPALALGALALGGLGLYGRRQRRGAQG